MSLPIEPGYYLRRVPVTGGYKIEACEIIRLVSGEIAVDVQGRNIPSYYSATDGAEYVPIPVPEKWRE